MSAVSAYVAVLAYRRSGKKTLLDLRIQLRSADDEIHRRVRRLEGKLTDTKVAVESSLTAMGAANSGAMQRHRAEHQRRIEALDALRAELPPVGASYPAADIADIESEIVRRKRSIGEATDLEAECAAVAERAEADLARHRQMVQQILRKP